MTEQKYSGIPSVVLWIHDMTWTSMKKRGWNPPWYTINGAVVVLLLCLCLYHHKYFILKIRR